MRNPVATLLTVLAAFALQVFASTSEPIVLVHGLAGFKENWGYVAELQAAGFTVLNFNIGKFTSTRNRAAEIYAQLKGTVVDYGKCHTDLYTPGHRYGKNYTGKALYPQWDENHKIHIFGHSLGGPTITMLERLLRQGSGCAQDTSPLYTGGHNWIKSLTSFSGVLSGTSMIDILDERDLLDFIKNLVGALAGLIDNTFLDTLYEIDFGHWNLERAAGESFDHFWDRVEASGYLTSANHDISVYDLSKEGARANNALGPLQYADTYYFSFATERTHPDQDCAFLWWFCGEVEEDPDSGMTIFFHPFADWIGEDSIPIERKNDGLVNWINQICPIVDEADYDRCTEFDGTHWPIGQWIYKNVDYLDHLQVVSKDSFAETFNYAYSAKKLFVDHAQRLKNLP